MKQENQEEFFTNQINNILGLSPFVLLVIGPPCSGKGTNTLKLKHCLDVLKRNETIVISPGEELRKFSKESELNLVSKNVLEKMKQGDTVDILTKISVIGPKIIKFLSNNSDGNIIFDGSPRDIDETRAILSFFSSNKNLRHKIVTIDFSERIHSSLTNEERIKKISEIEKEIFKRSSKRKYQQKREDDYSQEIVFGRVRKHFDKAGQILAYIRSFKIPIRDISFVNKDEYEVFSCFLKNVTKGLKTFDYANNNKEEQKINLPFV